ncbi:MAG: hypothetical protein NXH85_05205 [Pseudomonadaceae bacterium]|nr:hypothetical protein [Pseudomonadaceae bacterium]
MPTNADIRLPGSHTEQASSCLLSFEFADCANDHALLSTVHLSGPVGESWLVGGDVEPVRAGAFTGLRGAEYQFLSCQANIDAKDGADGLRDTTRRLYQDLIRHVEGSRYSQPVRFWNYVPDINHLTDPADADSEAYRQFCWGRAEALENADFPLPAATAVGCADGKLHIGLLTATDAISVTHFENPRQVSAYHYPRQYGPRSPSFARASIVESNSGSLLLLSGTASIVAHESIHAGELDAQMQETAHNIDALLTSVTGSADVPHERFKPLRSRCYLRTAAERDAAERAFANALPTWPEPAIMTNDICRAELVMEIEAVFTGD